MYAPIPARQLSSPHGYYAGACQCAGIDNSQIGWLVHYCSDPSQPRQSGAIVKLFVRDLSGSAFSDWIPFFVDTGAPVTILPRNLLSNSAFRGEPLRYGKALGITKFEVIAGNYYAASLTFRAPGAPYQPVSITRFEPLVIPEWDQKFGLLGLDVLRQTIMVADPDHITFWPLPNKSAEAKL